MEFNKTAGVSSTSIALALFSVCRSTICNVCLDITEIWQVYTADQF